MIWKFWYRVNWKPLCGIFGGFKENTTCMSIPDAC